MDRTFERCIAACTTGPCIRLQTAPACAERFSCRDSALLSNQWSLIEAAVRQSGVSEALYRHGAVDDTGYALLLGGEAAGRLGDILDHETRRLGQLVALWRDSLVDWIPAGPACRYCSAASVSPLRRCDMPTSPSCREGAGVRTLLPCDAGYQ